MNSLYHKDWTSSFQAAGIWTHHSRISLYPNLSIIHLQLLNLLVKWTGFFLSPVFQSWCVFPLLLTFPSSSGCALAGSQIKRCIMFLNQLCMAELHWEPGVSMNQLKCPTGVAVTLMCYILTTHCREIECWVGLNVMESSLGAFLMCVFLLKDLLSHREQLSGFLVSRQADLKYNYLCSKKKKTHTRNY